jgi:hypothetical protein
VRQVVSVCYFQHQPTENLRSEAESSIKIAFVACRFPSVRLAPVNEESLPRVRSMHRTPIRVLLNTSFYESDDEVFMSMARETVLHVIRVDDLSRTRSTEAINLNPLCRMCHTEKITEGTSPHHLSAILGDRGGFGEASEQTMLFIHDSKIVQYKHVPLTVAWALAHLPSSNILQDCRVAISKNGSNASWAGKNDGACQTSRGRLREYCEGTKLIEHRSGKRVVIALPHGPIPP